MIAIKLGVPEMLGLRLYPQNLTWLIPAEESVDSGHAPKRRASYSPNSVPEALPTCCNGWTDNSFPGTKVLKRSLADLTLRLRVLSLALPNSLRQR
jgi:hypothetical protein